MTSLQRRGQSAAVLYRRGRSTILPTCSKHCNISVMGLHTHPTNNVLFFRAGGNSEKRSIRHFDAGYVPRRAATHLGKSEASSKNSACWFLVPFISCECMFSSHSFWTSSSLDVPARVTQEEGHTGFFVHLPSAVRALIFLARRIQPSFLSLVDREVEFRVLTI